MLRYLSGLLLLLVLASSVQAAPVPEVQDKAELFKPETIDKANQVIRLIKREYKKDLLIETFPAIPAAKEAEFKELGKQEFFSRWVLERARENQVKGICILICKNPGHFEVDISRDTRNAAGLTVDNYKELNAILQKDLGAGHFDQALLDSVQYVEKTLQSHAGRRGSAQGVVGQPAAGQGQPGHTNPAQAHPGGGFGLGGLLCVGLVAVLGVLLVVGLMRGMSGGGFGGGGFLPSLLGGLFGAAAGMWIYDSFFRGSAFGGGGSPFGGSDTSGTGGDAGNGNWGGNDDYAGGGGDFGGGDAGGGGDFGGGGGDFGGGGNDF